MIFSSKIILCGDATVGKTSLRNKFFGKGFNSAYIPTIGADVSILNYSIDRNDESIDFKLSIWDLAGQISWFSEALPRFYQGSQAIILVYDVTNKNSFENVINWLTGISQHITIKNMPILVIGNKIDLNRTISTSEGTLLTKKVSEIFITKSQPVSHVETSALTGENVNSALETLVNLLLSFYHLVDGE